MSAWGAYRDTLNTRAGVEQHIPAPISGLVAPGHGANTRAATLLAAPGMKQLQVSGDADAVLVPLDAGGVEVQVSSSPERSTLTW